MTEETNQKKEKEEKEKRKLEKEDKTKDRTIQEILDKAKEKNPKANLELIKKAYDFAHDAHKDDLRKSGEPFIIHPLNVAYTVAELSLDEASICAALLHDVVEDTGKKLEEIRKEFGVDIANLVDGVTKLSEVKPKSKEHAEAENIRKILLATCTDLRVIVIKLADKLHNMKTLEFLNPKRQVEIAEETLDVYAPIAYRLGMEQMKGDLEDLAFKFVYPEIYGDLSEKIRMKREERDLEIDRFRKIIDEKLKENGITAKIKGRAKHLYSIWKKMQRKNRPFEEIYDIIALRIITNTIKECYDVLGIIHQMWRPIPGHIKDYIAMPKSNMYQSLHTIVLADKGKIIEIQIRTQEMDKVANEGIAAHYAYKGVVSQDKKFDKKLSWLKEIQEWQKEEKDAQRFLDSLKVDLFQDEIYCFTPKGDVIELSKGATVLDFAYAIHTNLGDTCAGGRVNGTFASLRQTLRTGDVIEIVTAKTQHPARSWLKIVKTSKARSKIKRYLQEKHSVPIANIVTQKEKGEVSAKGILEIEGIKDPKSIKLAKCCLPLPGDLVVGYATRTDIVTVHKQGCPSIPKTESESKKKVKVSWLQNVSTIIELKVDALDRVGLFADILNTASASGTNMKSATAKIIDKDFAEVTLNAEIDDLEHLKDIINRIKKIQSVRRVYVGKIGM